MSGAWWSQCHGPVSPQGTHQPSARAQRPPRPQFPAHPSGRAMGTGSLTLQDDSDGVGPEPFSSRAQGLVLSCGERHRGAPSGGVGGARTPLPPHFTSALPCMEQQILNSAPPVWIEDPLGSAPAPLPPFPPRAHPKFSHSLVLAGGQSSQGLPQARPREQQQEALVTPTPISALQEMPPSPRSCVSRKQFPTRVSAQGQGWSAKHLLENLWVQEEGNHGILEWSEMEGTLKVIPFHTLLWAAKECEIFQG